jgi:hypothetical protein
MTGRLFAAFLLIAATMLCIGLKCHAAQEAVEFTANGSINWTRGILNASGTFVSVRTSPRGLLDSQKALASAKIAAYDNLLKVAQSVRIDNTRTVGDFAEKNAAVMDQLMDMVKHAAIIDQRYSTNGTAEVAVEMSLLSGFSQLVLPVEIESVESIQPFKTDHADDSAEPEKTAPQKEIFSGFIIDARGIGIDPVMAPKILDENRQEVYGPAFVSRELAVQKGMCLYETDLDAAQHHPKAGKNPLVVKGLRTESAHGTDIVICNADALKIKSASEHLEALKQCNVIIVTDPPISGR